MPATPLLSRDLLGPSELLGSRGLVPELVRCWQPARRLVACFPPSTDTCPLPLRSSSSGSLSSSMPVLDYLAAPQAHSRALSTHQWVLTKQGRGKPRRAAILRSMFCRSRRDCHRPTGCASAAPDTGLGFARMAALHVHPGDYWQERSGLSWSSAQSVPYSLCLSLEGLGVLLDIEGH